METNNSDHSTFIFWLSDFAWHRISASTQGLPKYFRVDVDVNYIKIYQEETIIELPLSLVQTCETYQFYFGYTRYGTNVKIKFTERPLVKTFQKRYVGQELMIIPIQEYKPETLYLIPVDVFRHRNDKQEIDDMVIIINTLRKGEIPNLSTNPYHRELLRIGSQHQITEREWDPTSPPAYYSSVPTYKKILMQFFVYFPLLMLAFALIVAIIVLIYQWLFR